MPPRARDRDVTDTPNDGSTSDKPQPTPAEAYLFFTLIKNMRSKPDIDWDQVAIDNGFKNAETAKVRFGQIKRKLGLIAWGEGSTATPGSASSTRATAGGGTPRTPRNPRPKKQPVGSSPLAAADETSEIVEEALGPVPAGVKKSRAKRAVRPKIEDHGSGDALIAAAVKGNKKSAHKASVVKNEEVGDEDGNAALAPPAEVGGGVAMELDGESNDRGRITTHDQGEGRPIKQDSNEEEGIALIRAAPAHHHHPRGTTTSVQVHPGYVTAMLAPIPGTAGSFHATQFPAQNNDDQGFYASIESGPIRDRTWDSDDDGVMAELRNQAQASNNTMIRQQNMANPAAYNNAGSVRPAMPADNGTDVDNAPEVSLSSMMAGGLPGGGSSGIYTGGGGPHHHQHHHRPPSGFSPQQQDHWDLDGEGSSTANNSRSLFGASRGGGGGGRGGGHGGRGGYGSSPPCSQ